VFFVGMFVDECFVFWYFVLLMGEIRFGGVVVVLFVWLLFGGCLIVVVFEVLFGIMDWVYCWVVDYCGMFVCLVRVSLD